MAFNPDEYLAEKTGVSGFNPDAYLAEKTGSKLDDSPVPEKKQTLLERFKEKQNANLSAKDVIAGAITNAPASIGNALSGLGNAIAHPLDTAKSVLDIGAGALQNALPASLVNAIGADIPSQEKANAVGQLYKQRYGSLEGIKQAIATDPASVAMDASTLLTGGGSLVSKIPQLAKAGRVVSSAGDVINPLNVVTKPAAYVGGKILNPNMGNPLSSAHAAAVDLLKSEGVPVTAGQLVGGRTMVTESKATSIPAVGDLISWRQGQGIDKLNEAAYNRALAPIGEKSSGNVGFSGVEEVHSKLSNAYSELASKMHLVPDNQLTQELGSIQSMAGHLPNGYGQLYNDLKLKLIDNRATPQGLMSGETLKAVETSINQEVSKLRKSNGYETGKVADALEETMQSIRENLARQNPEWASQLQKVNQGWANYAIIRDAASKATGRKGGAFTPAQLANSVSSNAKSQSGQTIGKARISEGRANMQDLSSAAENVLAPAYNDSGTAGRLSLAGAAAYMRPEVLAGLAAGSVPYLPGANKVVEAALSKRTSGMRKAGKAVAGSDQATNALYAAQAGKFND